VRAVNIHSVILPDQGSPWSASASARCALHSSLCHVALFALHVALRALHHHPLAAPTVGYSAN
jgi:hypothetical protein